ncbi:AraC family transcriptional regulator [Streptomyces sp. NPDC093085]|uniref:AraC family transcriptional regulator n=1 Tax=Streptomyces sp. NPDC093085 TaxID=3155068 RepID=UPI003445EBD9
MLDRLTAAIDRHHTEPGAGSAVPRLSLVSVDEPIEPTGLLYEPMICFVSDGAKRTTAGDVSQVAHAGEMLMTTIDLPVAVRLDKVPYRSAVLSIDGAALAGLLVEVDETDPAAPATPVAPTAPAALTGQAAPTGQVAAPMPPELVEAVARWVELLDTPEDIRPLAPRIESEILYRLLRGSLGPALRQCAQDDSPAGRVRQAARWICEHYTEPVSIAAIAASAQMSPASLHRHFKAATGMSPLTYQKRLRLQEARRRLVAGATANQAAQAVGYVSATQFNREYRTAYGLPPARDAARLRTGPRPLPLDPPGPVTHGSLLP